MKFQASFKGNLVTTVNAITCPICGYTIFSRACHDLRTCFCGKVSIDGGFDYVRICFDPEIKKPPELFKKDIPQTPMELYNDWKEQNNVYGRIPPIFDEEL